MPLKLKKKISPGKISHKNAKNSCQRVAKGKKGAKTRVGWQSPKNMMHNFMIIVFNQRMIQTYMEELMIKLATLLKNIIMHHVL